MYDHRTCSRKDRFPFALNRTLERRFDAQNLAETIGDSGSSLECTTSADFWDDSLFCVFFLWVAFFFWRNRTDWLLPELQFLKIKIERG
jgi:hypothetical protein